MTQEERDLLAIAIAAYYPYGLWCELDDQDEPMMLDSIKYHDTYCFDGVFERYITQFKPYLRPMSSMTGECRTSYDKVLKTVHYADGCFYTPDIFDWLTKHFFDYRGLIGLGLALEAPEGMYNDNKQI